MSFSIDMVSKLEIYECPRLSRQPCSHRCKITLLGGKSKTKLLDLGEIYYLVDALAREKISYTDPYYDINHILEVKDNLAIYEWSMGGAVGQPPPTVPEILANFFKETDK